MLALEMFTLFRTVSDLVAVLVFAIFGARSHGDPALEHS
jgi:hypothetical protein